MPEPKTTIIPYCEVNGIRTFKDSEIMDFYRRMQRDGFDRWVFISGDITSPETFLKEMKRFGAATLYVVFHGEIDVGMFWLTHFEHRSCRAHFTTFSEAKGLDTVAIGREAIRQIMYLKTRGGDYVFDVIMGLTASENRAAVRWIEKVGFRRIGEIPNAMWHAERQESVPAVLTCLTRREV